jgi:hypothetical protein
MNPPDKPVPGKEAAKPKLWAKPKLGRSEEALRIIEEYAASLRETIKKFRRHLN